MFSTGDPVQTPLGTKPNRRGEGRTLPDNDQVFNHRFTWGGLSEPKHSTLHTRELWEHVNLRGLVNGHPQLEWHQVPAMPA